jgi:type I restriction enzyme R subunit
MLFKAPFNDTHQDGLIEVFDDSDAYKVISIIERINENAMIG